jgi:hypothetical protein
VSDPAVILQEFDRLANRGHEILHVCGWDGKRFTAFKPVGLECLKFRTQVMAITRRTFGEDSDLYTAMRTIADGEQDATAAVNLNQYLTILERARERLQHDMFFDPDAVIAGLLHEELIELAEVFIHAGCHLHAAQRTGGVLEHTLRDLAERHGVEAAQAVPVDQLIDTLAAMKTISDREVLRIGAIRQMARDAAGDQAPHIHPDDVEDIVTWVRQFQLDHRY